MDRPSSTGSPASTRTSSAGAASSPTSTCAPPATPPGTRSRASRGARWIWPSAAVEGTALVAVRDGPTSVTVYRQGAGNGSATAVAVDAKVPLFAFKLLGGGPVPVLWTIGQNGAARLYWLTQGGVKGVDVPLA